MVIGPFPIICTSCELQNHQKKEKPHTNEQITHSAVNTKTFQNHIYLKNRTLPPPEYKFNMQKTGTGCCFVCTIFDRNLAPS